MQTGDKPPMLLKYRSSTWFVCATVSLAVFTDIFLYAVIVPVIPFALQERSNIDASDVQSWVSILIAVYGASLLACSPLFGWLSDTISSRRVPLIFGLFALAGATVMINVGSSIGILIAGRVLQGASAAVVWVVGLALLVDTVGQEDVGQAMGYVSMAMSLAIMLGPLLGGVVFDKAGYTAVFAMAYGLIGLDVVLRLVLVEKKVARRYEKKEVDERADNKPSAKSEPTPQPLRRRFRDRLPPTLSLLTSRRLAASLWATLTVSILFSSFDAVLPLFVRQTFHWSSTGAGLIFLPIVIPSFLSPFVGLIADRSGPRLPTAAGFLASMPFFVLLRLVDHDSLRQKVLLCALLALTGAALVFVMPCVMAEITYVVRSKERTRPGLYGEKGAYAQAYGLFNMAWAGGALVGPIWAGYVRDSAGWGTMAWSLGLLSGVTAVPALLWTGGWIGKGWRGDAGGGGGVEPVAAV
ncbi:MFS general substrate transporter [Saccharata proteae CBS 121410]|uniref:MFS general substrate transporter n=1 Tax=Saccharata proteae CBS 121410 TaxID=1314787 RepID=A0A9P4I2E6_9PEZI|nr:MFS general substrate transporter [Saccharata proteae CBS 121410]